MPIEVEQKFRVADLEAIAHRAEQFGFVRGEPVRQVDAYFSHPTRDFSQTDEALRLRRVGDRNVATYKGPKLDATTKTRREIELPLADGGPSFSAWAELLTTLGFARVREVAKTRTPYRLTVAGRTMELVLDEVDGLGAFVEIETLAGEQDLEAARDAVNELAGRFGLAEPERRSYLELLLASD